MFVTKVNNDLKLWFNNLSEDAIQDKVKFYLNLQQSDIITFHEVPDDVRVWLDETSKNQIDLVLEDGIVSVQKYKMLPDDQITEGNFRTLLEKIELV